MTYLIVKCMHLTMALIGGTVNVVLLVLLSIGNCSQTSTPSPSVSNKSSKLGFYEKCESLIKKEVMDMKEASLSNEVKLAGMSSTAGVIHFYPKGRKLNKGRPMFSWRSRTNPNVAEEIIVLSVYGNQLQDDYIPSEWMSGAFIILRKLNGTGSSSSKSKTYYYALVAYVRKDHNGNRESIEWDRFSPRVIRNLFQKQTDLEAAESFTVETFMCSYGTCACAACKCSDGANDKEIYSKQENVTRSNNGQTDKNRERNKNDSEGKLKRKPIETTETKAKKSKPQKKRNFHGVAGAIAKSATMKGDARSRSEADEKGRHALANSLTQDGNAVAEAISHRGTSSSFAHARNNSLAEATSGHGGASSRSSTYKGAAQSSSSGREGNLTAEAVMIGSEEFNYYDDIASDSNEDFDGKALVRDTNKKFAEANNRSEQMKSQASESNCLKESEVELSLTEDELMYTLEIDNGNKSLEKDFGVESFYYTMPNRYGIDVEVGVNSSVLIATAIPGYIAPRGSCCGLDLQTSSIIRDFLREFKQDCNSELETQVRRLEISYHKATLKQIMKTKRLTLQYLRDLVPMVLLKAYEARSTRKAIKFLKRTFNNSASDHINKIVAMVINSAHYAVTTGKLHKVKILKGLVLNVRTVLTGILLEFKRCRKDTTEFGDCSKEYKDRLRSENRLLLGLYYFLKFADSRYSYFNFRRNRPAHAFAHFMRVHDASITKLVYCKSRRIIINSA